MNDKSPLYQTIHTFSSTAEFSRVLNLIHQSGVAPTCGQMIGSSKALFIAELAQKINRPLVVVTPEQSDAYLLLDDLLFFLQGKETAIPVFVFPHLEILPYESHAPELTIRMERLAPIQHFMEHADSAPNAFIVVIPIAAILKRLPPLQMYERNSLRFQTGMEINRETVSQWLVTQGYEFRDLIAQRGDFSVRGDIIDIYSFSHPDPLRVEFWGDEVESIRLFDVSTQRSKDTIRQAFVYPSNEDPLISDALTLNQPLRSLPALFGDDTPTIFIEQELIEKQGVEFYRLADKRYRETLAGNADDLEVHLGEADFHKRQQILLAPPETLYFSYNDFLDEMDSRATVILTEFTLEPQENHVNFGFGAPQIFGEDKNERIQALIRSCLAGEQVHIVCDNTGQQGRMDEILDDQRKKMEIPPDSPFPQTLVGDIHRGFFIHGQKLLLCTDREIFGRYRRFRTPLREGIALPMIELVDLKPGDYVVHIDHGIGRFVALRRMEHDGKEGEFLEIHYADNGVLYVPIEQVDRVGRYIGGNDVVPTLSKLGTKNWDRCKTRAKQAIEDMAEELLELYATRSIRKGHAYAKDTTWQHEFEASFLYEETADQWRAIEEVKRDMEDPQPMDRLICGDVGFGKTEVAIRAAFKSAMDGKQVAILAPTTILCEQHYNTFRERLAEYPVQIEMLSRFRSPGELKQGIQRIQNGDIDIAIGTHRLLSKDVQFHDLGLVIIDEEQRFGVKHKERLRQMRQLVDTLTLSATPIPRTLYMSLSGIRNMSLISTPPKNRLPIETYVMEWSTEAIENAILRELYRDGQVYIVHNRVESILQIANYIQDLVPNARVCVGHGQMSEHELEKVMMNFIRHEYDILVATTIIENGLDIPNVNTIIINHADHFGLSQLYQLRGRVGRDRHRAYCYLLVPSKKALSSIARRRLLALQEHNQLGAGFHLAMRDMEIRGIGNILGRQQHGHIAAIGFDLYSKLLSETVNTMKGKKGYVQQWETTLEITPKGAIPPTYVESSKQRMALHQRIAKIKTDEEIDHLREELQDIYGKPPQPVERMLQGLQIRVKAYQAGMDLVHIGKNLGFLSYHPSQAERFNPLRILQLDGKNGMKLHVETKGDHLLIRIEDVKKSGKLIDQIIPLIDALQQEPESDPDMPVPPPPPEMPKKKKIRSKKPLRQFY
ncbi:MAG: transcription-repair coupling factor [Candidatus Omnitrophota bacterium]|jgi:transcription-repair coupling factor (superfamily II helicase)|nr:MAG: transcription-repair coupling factor [Candidatus Omnitrophota bacterium]